MKDIQIKLLVKCVLLGLILSSILVLIGFTITKYASFNLKDVLFFEGIIVVMFAALSSVGGIPIGLSLQGMGQNNAQYVANATLEAARMEKESKVKTLRKEFNKSTTMASLVIAGVICIITNFII